MGRERKSFINELGRGTVSFTDEEFVRIKRLVERRGCDAAHVTVAPVDTAQYCSPRPYSSELSFDARICMEKKEEGKWTRSRISSNHHRLVRVLKYTDSSVT